MTNERKWYYYDEQEADELYREALADELTANDLDDMVRDHYASIARDVNSAGLKYQLEQLSLGTEPQILRQRLKNIKLNKANKKPNALSLGY